MYCRTSTEKIKTNKYDLFTAEIFTWFLLTCIRSVNIEDSVLEIWVKVISPQTRSHHKRKLASKIFTVAVSSYFDSDLISHSVPYCVSNLVNCNFTQGRSQGGGAMGAPARPKVKFYP